MKQFIPSASLPPDLPHNNSQPVMYDPEQQVFVTLYSEILPVEQDVMDLFHVLKAGDGDIVSTNHIQDTIFGKGIRRRSRLDVLLQKLRQLLSRGTGMSIRNKKGIGYRLIYVKPKSITVVPLETLRSIASEQHNNTI
ncbi:helix-turn-helix domain-containing protein [Chitinophaga sp. 212800010-3]|uniref:helix-turn-helix domain-containing protein n=1 Tax=unclassified Chitinophaga TaxID=2619133 RepID=UPI002DE93EA1|nr:hypothetical protein [Chitinophaga sp. 212800010-3]